VTSSQVVRPWPRPDGPRFGISEFWARWSLEGGNQEVFLGPDLMPRSAILSKFDPKRNVKQIRLIVDSCYPTPSSWVDKATDAALRSPSRTV